MFSPSSIADFLACPHLTALNRQQREGTIEKPYFQDPGLDLLIRLGEEHEQKYLKDLKAKGRTVVEIPTEIPADLNPGIPAESGSQRSLLVEQKPARVPVSQGAKTTREAMVAGAEVIYQATFLQGQWGGRADFLIRVHTPSDLGPWSYEVVETKLAKTTKARAIIQLCFYSELVAAIQGKLPERMHVVLGRGAEPEEFVVQKYIAYFRKIKREFELALASPQATYPEPVEHCMICAWFTVCDEKWHADDHLSLVANITRNQRQSLSEREIRTMAILGAFTPPGDPPIERIGPITLTRIREQARIQVEGREHGKYLYELLDPDQLKEKPRVRRKEALATQLPVQEAVAENESLRGLAALPSPSPGDLFLDFEGDPFAFDQGLEYLIGTVRVENQEKAIHKTKTSHEITGNKKNEIYEAIWAFNPAEEKKAFEKFIAKVMARWRQYPDMHIYHYAPYETTAIKHLSGRHNVCSDEVDQLLRAQVFVDLHRVVRQSLRASVESYSIKKMEPFYGFNRAVPLRNATSALQAFESVLALADDPAEAQPILQTIADYNRDDCVSTLRLREWLETLRSELEKKLERSIPRPECGTGAPGEKLEEQLTEITELKARLTKNFPEDEDERTEVQQAVWLLAQLLEWYRREDKSMWWEYYRLCTLSDEELIEDKNALGGLDYQGVVEETNKSLVHRYTFPPQDHTLNRAQEVHDPNTEKSAGELVGIDELNRTIDLKRGKGSKKPHPTALIPNDYIGSKEQVGSLMRIARWVAENGIQNARDHNEEKAIHEITRNSTNEKHESADSRMFQAARDVLLRSPPRLRGGDIETFTNGLSPLEGAKRLALALDNSILPIQGPPGSGKTYTGAHMIIELVNAGKKVGVIANSHKVIGNLLSAICKAAAETRSKVSIVQKVSEVKDGYKHDCVEVTTSNDVALNKLTGGEAQVVAATAWLWSRAGFARSIDVLFVDEAGQMSLANVLAVSPAAESVVLLGDPQQLDQPQKGVHPPGAEVSALSHLLNERPTIEAGQGLFLSESWRLHPDLCAFTSETFYEGRLATRPENSLQRLNAKGPLGGTGLRFVTVSHAVNQSDSPEEAETIAELINGLLNEGATWTNKKGETALITLDDILIVAPYNAQVALIAGRLPGARVGTVDKFQGQEAPVVFYSMTTSSPEDAPRGMEFLYSSNRLNVATSRAQCVTVLVANPKLFDVQCKTPRQMELANAFCRYLELSSVV